MQVFDATIHDMGCNVGVAERLTEALAAVERNAPDPEALEKLRAFYDKMKALGLVKKREYDLPLVDTIGRDLMVRSAAKDLVERLP